LTPAGLERLLFSGVLAATQLGIALYVLIKGHHRTIKYAFAMLGASLAVWTIAIGFAHGGELSSLFAVRLAFSSAAVLVLSLFTFVIVFPASALPRSRSYWGFATAGFFLSVLSLSSLVVASTSYSDSGLTAVYGPLHRVFAAYVVVGILATFVVIRAKIRSSSGRERLQLRYLLLALLVPAVGIATTNLVIPVFFGVSTWGRYGPIFTLVFLGVTAHAIIRQRLMNIRLIVGQTISYAAAVLVSGTLFGVALFLIATPSSAIPELPLAIQLTAAFAFALLFAPLARTLRRIFDRYCFREPYDYSATIRQGSLALSSTLDLQQLLKNLFDLIRNSIRPEFLIAYVRDQERGNFHVALKDDEEDTAGGLPALEPSHPLVSAFETRSTPLFPDSAGKRADGAVAILREMAAECACPIIHESNVLGILILGGKRSGDAYYAQDIELLSTLAGNAAVAIKNAELYQRVTSLEVQRRRAERVAESGALTAGIAHEIKNPLVAIRTFAELLPERYEDEEFRSQFGRVMITEIARIDKLIDRLRGRTTPQNDELPLLDIRIPVDEVLSLLTGQFQRSGITVTKSIETDETVVKGRLDDLKQLFLNVLINACEEMTKGGKINITISRRTSLGSQSVTVDIWDEGPGLSDSVGDRLFHPFTSTKPGSSGLGLWLSRRIADAHNATIRGVNRSDRRGALFTVEFPAQS